MEFVSIEDFLDDVMPEVAGCTEFIAMDRIRWAAIELCRKSLVSQYTMEEIDLEKDEPFVYLPSPGQYVRVHLIMWARTANSFLTGLERQPLADRNLDWSNSGSSQWPVNYVRVDHEQIRVIPTPDRNQGGALDVHAAFIPTRSATKVDAVLIDDWREAVTNGALARLLNMSKESWFNPVSAREHEIEFRIQISNARAAVNKDRLLGSTRVQMVHFA